MRNQVLKGAIILGLLLHSGAVFAAPINITSNTDLSWRNNGATALNNVSSGEYVFASGLTFTDFLPPSSSYKEYGILIKKYPTTTSAWKEQTLTSTDSLTFKPTVAGGTTGAYGAYVETASSDYTAGNYAKLTFQGDEVNLIANIDKSGGYYAEGLHVQGNGNFIEADAAKASHVTFNNSKTNISTIVDPTTGAFTSTRYGVCIRNNSLVDFNSDEVNITATSGANTSGSTITFMVNDSKANFRGSKVNFIGTTSGTGQVNGLSSQGNVVAGTTTGLFFTGNDAEINVNVTATGTGSDLYGAMLKQNAVLDVANTAKLFNMQVKNEGTTGTAAVGLYLGNGGTSTDANLHADKTVINVENPNANSNWTFNAITLQTQGNVVIDGKEAELTTKGKNVAGSTIYVNNGSNANVFVNADKNTIKAIATNSTAVDAGYAVVSYNSGSKVFINSDNTGADLGKTVEVEGALWGGAGGSIWANFTDANSKFTGWTTNGGSSGYVDLSIDNGALWNVQANSVLNHLKTTNGKIDLSYNPNYQLVNAQQGITGNGTTFVLKTDLQASADNKDVTSNSDRIYLWGDSSTGTYNIEVKDASKTSLIQAQDGYLLLVQDGTTNPGAVFTSSSTIQNGGLFKYPVVITSEDPDPADGYINVPTGKKNWYLTLNKIVPTPPTPPTPPAPTFNAFANIGFAENRYLALVNEQDTLLQRLGELRDDENANGVWTRIKKGSQSVNDSFAGTSSYTMYQLGYDKKIKDTDKVKSFVGLAYNHTNSSQAFDNVLAKGTNSSDALTLYNTNLYSKGHYLDLVAKLGRSRGDFDLYDSYGEAGDSNSNFYSLSAEYGRKKLMGTKGWYVEPQVQLTYAKLGSADYTTSQDTTGYLEGIKSLIFRTGTTVGRHLENNKSNYYGKVFWNKEFLGNANYSFADKNGATLSDNKDFGSTWWTVGIGANMNLNTKTNFYLDLSKNFGGEVQTKWLVDGGFRWEF